MNKKKLILLGMLFSTFILLSCEIDEEKNLLFQLKDNLQVVGRWQNGLDGFTFEADGTFTARIKGDRGEGEFIYEQSLNESIFRREALVATFTLTWDKKLKSADPKRLELEVKKAVNGDFYFKYDTKRYTQIS